MKERRLKEVCDAELSAQRALELCIGGHTLGCRVRCCGIGGDAVAGPEL